VILELGVESAAPDERVDLEQELRTLLDWVRREHVPGVRVALKPPEVEADRMGGPSDIVEVIVGAGDVVAALAGISAALHTWLSSRRIEVTTTVARGGRTVTFTRSMSKAELEQLLLQMEEDPD
jgi:hypothetical protein